MKHSKSGLFLMELIIALLFFSLASTVCIRLFVKSRMLSDNTVDLTYAVTQAQNLAEGYVACDGDLAQVQFLFPGSELTADNLLQLEEDNYISTISASGENEDGLITGDISVSLLGSDEVIYSLQVQRHVPERSGGHE